jgi:hypothetical protein
MYFLIDEDDSCIGHGATPELAFKSASDFANDCNLATVKVYEGKEVKLIISVDPDSRT